jgi:hypothetical protein
MISLLQLYFLKPEDLKHPGRYAEAHYIRRGKDQTAFGNDSMFNQLMKVEIKKLSMYFSG